MALTSAAVARLPVGLRIGAIADRRRLAVLAALAALTLVAGLGLGWRAVERHQALETNAEDLGFTDQVIWNFLRGQAFRFTTYQHAEFETDIDLAAIRRPDSLLAFHVEPILVLLAPLYLVVPDVRAILWLQAIAIALGAIPAYRLARRRLGHPQAGLAFAGLYLLAPPGQWAATADFHSVALAAPLLLLAVDALDAGQPRLFLVAGLLAAATKEEVGLIVAGLGLVALLGLAPVPAAVARSLAWLAPVVHAPATLGSPGGVRAMRWAATAAVVLGAGWSILCVAVIIPHYSGGAISPFTARYAPIGGSPGAALRTLVEDPAVYLTTLGRPEVLGYLATLLLCGGWLGLLAPELLLAVAPILALNVFSSSPWMAAGRAHYSATVLPLVIAAAIVGAGRLATLGGRWGDWPFSRVVAVLSVAAVLGGAIAYRQAGIGPLVAGLPTPTVSPHDELGRQLAASIPQHASVSASTALYPHLSQRAGAYLFPTVHDAEYVLVDVGGSPYPAGPGSMHKRLQELLTRGEYRLQAAEDGLVLLKRGLAAEQPLPDRFYDFARSGPVSNGPAPVGPPAASFHDGAIEMLSARLVPSSEIGPRGPLATLETLWRVRRAVPERPRPSIEVRFRDGTRQTFDNLPVLWWYPPERWRPGETIRLDVARLTAHEVVGWEADAPLDPPPAPEHTPAPEPATTAGPVPVAQSLKTSVATEHSATSPGLGPNAGAADDADVTRDGLADASQADPAAPEAGAVVAPLGELTARVERDPWRLTLLDARGRVLWQEAPAVDGVFGSFGYVDRSGGRWRLTRLIDASPTDGALRLVAATDDPAGRTVLVELAALGPRAVRLRVTPDDPPSVARVGGAVVAETGERFLGFGERFDAVDQRGRVVRTWAEDRRYVGFGAATYAPIPWYVSSRGYGLLVESDARGTFDVAAERADRVAWQVEQPAASLLVIAGPSPRDILQDRVRFDGVDGPPLPPIWAFGVWKTAVGGSARVLRDAERIRAEALPVSALFVYDLTDEQSLLGWPWVSFGNRTTGPYRSPRQLTDRVHALGFKVLGYKNPDVPPAARVPPELLVQDAGGHAYLHPHHKVGWVDFTNPAAVDWWGGLWRRILDVLGLDGAMLDLGELVPEDARYADGTSGIETHNRYLTLYAKASFEAARAVRGDDVVLFARSASLGARAYQSLQWSGDQTISWNQEGIRGLLPAALSLGLSGFPYWHPEVGGYAGVGLPRASERELWRRWLQLGALSPVLRDNYGDHQGDPVEVWSDQETVAEFRRYARLHNSLVPYLYTQAKVASETGLPIVRHLALIAPNDPRAWAVEDAYALGDDLLVAPVLEEGARLRTVYLPAGTWVDWWTGRALQGGQVVTADAPLDRIPLFARAGAILPLAPDFDTLVPTADGRGTVWNGDLIVQVVAPPGEAETLPAARQRLYDGTTFGTRVQGGEITLTVADAPVERGYQVVLPADAPPARVVVDGRADERWSFSDGSVRLTVRAASFEVTVEPAGAAAARLPTGSPERAE